MTLAILLLIVGVLACRHATRELRQFNRYDFKGECDVAFCYLITASMWLAIGGAFILSSIFLLITIQGIQ